MLKHFGRKLKKSVHGHRPSSVQGDSGQGRSTRSSRSGASTSSEADSRNGAELDEKDSRLCRSWEGLATSLHRELSDSQRLEVLWTLGNCKDVKVADTIHIHTHEDDCNLSLVEWEALLVPLKSNPSLEEIHIRLPRGQPPETWEIIGRYWEEVVGNASALKKLSVSVYGLGSCEDIPISVDTDFETDASSISVLLPSVLEHLALGLGANPNPALEELYVEFGDSASSDTVDHVVEILECSLKKLRNLSLVDVPRLKGSEVEALSNALEQCTSLCALEIKGAEEGMTEVLLQRYRGSGSIQILLEELILRGLCIAGLGPALPQLLAANIKHLIVDFSDLVWGLGEDRGLRGDVNFPWREMGSVLLRTVCLRKFTILLECRDRVLGPRKTQIETCIKGLTEAWEASRHSPLFCISLNWDILDFHKYKNYADVLSYVDVLIKAVSLGGLKNVRVILDVTNSDDVEALMRKTEFVIDILNKNTSIETCSLGFTEGAGERSEMSIPQIRSLLVDHLRQNSFIKHLTLEPSFFQCLKEEVFREVMRLFTENFTVQQVDVNCEQWEHDGKVALVKEAIDRNARYAEEISLIREAGLKFGRAKAGRILLCGAPGAGKSRLKKSMVYAAKTDGLRSWISLDLKKGRISSSIRSKLEFRTEGTGISTLRDDDDMHLSLWDIGDRKIFRALEELLFPKTGPPCLFLFVFNPTEVSPGLSRKKENLESSFHQELKSWIRFIASNCAVTGASPPQMMVVLSHKDKMGRSEKDLKWAKDIMNQLRIAFKGVVDLCEFEGQDPDILLVNCFDSGDVRPLNESIFQHMRSVFEKLMAKRLVPQPAIDLTSVFARKPEEIWSKPIWRTKELHDYFCKENEALRNLDRETESTRTILDAVARYLHDVGIIVLVMIADSDLVVVDPSWMAKFLGVLISEGTWLRTSRVTTKSSDSHNGHGFVAVNTVHDKLIELTDRYSKEDIILDQWELLDLLFRLDLCFKLDSGNKDSGDSRYFMPAIVAGPEGARKPHWSLSPLAQWPCSSGDGARDFGYRLQCKERERTCLPKSFFPMFQIKLRKRLVQTLNMNEENVKCSRGLMEILEDGHEIFVECDGLGEDHIDIMVRSSSHETKEKARKFIHSNIIKFLEGTSASEMGCSGISWSLYILRTGCVTNLTPSEYRGDEQAITAEELKLKLKDNALWQMECTTKKPNISMDTWIDSCLQYQQSWPEIKDAAGKSVLPAGSELARELLSSREQREIKAFLRHLAAAVNHKPGNASGRTSETDVIKLNDEVYEIHLPLEDVPRVELVFFHGIAEHESDGRSFLTTWSTRPKGPNQVAGPNKDSSRECWLNTWLVSHEDLKLARVLTVAYDTSTRKTGSRGNFDSYQLAENVTHNLIVQADVGQHNCPVVLVGHCVGGLVIKKVCIQAFRNLGVENSHRGHYENFLKAVKGMFFYATPHSGFAPNAKLLDRQPSVPPSPSVRSAMKGDLMESLELWNKGTSRDNDDFAKIRRKFQWKTSGVGESNETKIQIDKNTIISEIVVREGSARAESTEGFAVVPNTDHFTICKPEDETSDNFLRLREFVIERVQEGS